MLKSCFLVMAIGLATPALSAQLLSKTPPAPESCAAMDTALPAELAGWTAKADLTAATRPSDLVAARIVPGRALNASLAQTSAVTYVTQPEKPGGSVSHGGIVSLTIDKAGTYVIALGSGLWVDMLRGKKALPSTAHGHGPACSTIRKMVEFALKPGRYTIQLAASGQPNVTIMVARRP